MPRPARFAPAGLAYHVINRGNRSSRIFHTDGDYTAFLKTMADSLKITPIRIFAWCLMPNHWHLVLWPAADTHLSRFVGQLSNTHVRRYHRFHSLDGKGHLYQGRFKSFPIQEDHHLLCVLRYVEANAFRAQLVPRAQDWPYSSLAASLSHPDDPAAQFKPLLSPWPVSRPDNWPALVNQPLPPKDLADLRTSLRRNRPFGDTPWTTRTAAHLHLAHTLRPSWHSTAWSCMIDPLPDSAFLGYAGIYA